MMAPSEALLLKPTWPPPLRRRPRRRRGDSAAQPPASASSTSSIAPPADEDAKSWPRRGPRRSSVGFRESSSPPAAHRCRTLRHDMSRLADTLKLSSPGNSHSDPRRHPTSTSASPTSTTSRQTMCSPSTTTKTTSSWHWPPCQHPYHPPSSSPSSNSWEHCRARVLHVVMRTPSTSARLPTPSTRCRRRRRPWLSAPPMMAPSSRQWRHTAKPHGRRALRHPAALHPPAPPRCSSLQHLKTAIHPPASTQSSPTTMDAVAVHSFMGINQVELRWSTPTHIITSSIMTLLVDFYIFISWIAQLVQTNMDGSICSRTMGEVAGKPSTQKFPAWESFSLYNNLMQGCCRL